MGTKKFFKLFGLWMLFSFVIFTSCVLYSVLTRLFNSASTVAAGIAIFGAISVFLIGGFLMNKIFKKILKVLATTAFFAVFVAGCAVIEPGYAGLKVNMMGSDRGLDKLPTLTGFQWYNPFTEDIIKYPTHIIRYPFTADSMEGSEANESIDFQSEEGSPVNVDAAISAYFEFDKIPKFYAKFKTEPEVFIKGYVRDIIRSACKEHAEKMKIADIFGQSQSLLESKVRETVASTLAKDGVIVENFSFISKFRVSEIVKNSIEAVIAQKQRAIEAEQKVVQAEAEANQAVATAQGQLTVKNMNADAAAYSIQKTAEAQAAANLKIAESITPKLIEYERVSKWDGKLPVTTLGSNAVPMFNLN